MKRYLPTRPGRLLALLGLFLAFAVAGWSASNRVWVQYAPGAKGQVMAALAKAGGHVHYEFDNINAVAVSLPEAAVAGISHNPSVTLVEPDPIRKMVSATTSILSPQVKPWGIAAVQADLVHSNLVTGSGVIVGVVDSGVFSAHEDLSAMPMDGFSGISGKPSTYWSTDVFGHGTHVSGTIAGQDNGYGVVGVAPGIDQLYMVKVFGDDGVWAYSSTLLDAVTRARDAGAKIVSMSLGGTLKSRTEQLGLDKIYNNGKGVLLVAAAGNDGNTRTSYPAGYSSVISVAAIDSSYTVASFSQQNSTVELAAPGVGVLSTVPYISASLNVNGSNYLASAMEGAAQATATGDLVDGGTAESVGGWSGKVVLVERGNISFADKVANVAAGGGVAAVVYNNIPGGFAGTLSPSTSTIPAISISQEDGQYLIAHDLGQSATVSAEVSIPASGYEAWDGTSMATPHVSGVAALIMSAVDGVTAGEVRDAMDATARDLGPAGRDNAYGYGLVQAQDAINYLKGVEPPPPDFAITSYGATKPKGKPGPFTVSFTTNENATGTITTVPVLDDSYSATGTSFSKTFQGSRGTTYFITVSATSTSSSATDSQTFTFTP